VSKRSQATLLERFQRLAEVSRQLASTLDLDTLLNHIVQAAADLSNAEAASILLYDENKQQLYFEAATNLSEPLMRGLIVPVEGSLAGWVINNRLPLNVSDTQKDPRHFDGIAKATQITTTSILVAPLIAKTKIVGVLEAINKLEGHFTEEDQDVLVALGAQAAVAIENTRLFQQSDLISELVHELRTPLASLGTAAHLLARHNLPAEQHERLTRVIVTETARLNELATAYLDLARLESGRAQFCAEQYDLGEQLEECANFMLGKAGENGLTISTSVPANLPPFRGDRGKIKQVVLNLLSNAIKFNRPGGQITLAVAVGQNELVLEVRDTGRGIGPAELQHLFEKFYRGQSTEQVTMGSGLGLAICKRIVEAHGGWIGVQSDLGVGTTFSVHLPNKN
jgi:signal transduction histidine kinase